MSVTTNLRDAVTSRILIAELDSTAQKARFEEKGVQQAIIEISGMLRIGMLISHTVLVTDAMLLDGSYFMRLGPDRVLRELGASESHYPLVITGPAPTLRAGLEHRLKNPDFLWSISGIEHGEAAPAVIREHWEQWIKYVETGIIVYRQQKELTAEMQLELPEFQHSASPELVSQLMEERKRSDAWNALEKAALSADDTSRIKSWWNGAYLRMIAENARADWITFEDSSSLPSHGKHSEIHLPARLVSWAREVGAPTVTVAWDASKHQRERLREKPTWSRLRDLAYAVTQVGTIASRKSVLFDSGLKMLIAVIAILVAIPGVSFSALEQPLTWIIFFGIVISTIPYDALYALIGLMKRDSRTALIFHRSVGTR